MTTTLYNIRLTGYSYLRHKPPLVYPFRALALSIQISLHPTIDRVGLGAELYISKWSVHTHICTGHIDKYPTGGVFIAA